MPMSHVHVNGMHHVMHYVMHHVMHHVMHCVMHYGSPLGVAADAFAVKPRTVRQLQEREDHAAPLPD